MHEMSKMPSTLKVKCYNPRNKYYIAQVWKDIRIRNAKVNWSILIWTPFVMSKHPMIAWMAIINRLPTKDRLKSWGWMWMVLMYCVSRKISLEIIYFLDACFHNNFGMRF